jgi:drug/metabolite transporter (DMT)-like permease
MNMSKLKVSGWITLALAAASLEPILIKFGYRDRIEPAQLIILKNITAVLVMLPLAGKLKLIGKSGFKRMIVPGFLLFTTNLMVFVALQQLQVVLLITIVTTTPALVAFVNHRMGREVAGAKFWLGAILCFFGVVCTLDYRDITVNYAGVLCACVSALSSTFYRVQMEDLTREYSPTACSLITFLVQAGLTLLAIPFVGQGAVSPQAYGLGLWLGISTIIANIAFLSALNMVGSTRISILTMLQRPLIIIIAAVTLKEQITVGQVTGIILVMVGVHLAQVKRGVSPEGQLAS